MNLLLFDIDGTLLNTSGAGARSMLAAGRDLYGEQFTDEGVEYAGRLDPLIISEMFHASGVERVEREVVRFRVRYLERLQVELKMRPAGACPGVHDLLEALGSTSATLGVLTGNFVESGSMKLRSCGIDPDAFRVRVWGDESPNPAPKRADLVEVALARWERMTSSSVHADRVIVIGDTPGDVECAKAHGCRSLAVTTGKFHRDALEAAGADLVLTDLSETRRVTEFLLRG